MGAPEVTYILYWWATKGQTSEPKDQRGEKQRVMMTNKYNLGSNQSCLRDGNIDECFWLRKKIGVTVLWSFLSIRVAFTAQVTGISIAYEDFQCMTEQLCLLFAILYKQKIEDREQAFWALLYKL